MSFALRERAPVPTSSWEAYGHRLDDLIAAFAPGWAVKRQRARAVASMLSSYRGASRDRLRGTWTPRGKSADADLLPELPALRERSRDLNRNDAFAAAVTNAVVANVIGTGIMPQSRVDRDALGVEKADPDTAPAPTSARRPSPKEETARAFEKSAERAWWRWCPQADAQHRLTFYEIQSLILRQILENGEVIAIPLMITDEPWRRYRLAYEIIEADRLGTPLGKHGDPSIRDGVELGSRGQPVAYWIRKSHPGDASIAGTYPSKAAHEYLRYPAINDRTGRKNLFHLYWTKRPGQTRGEPFFSPVMSMFKDLGAYMEAEIVAARVGACFAAFITRTNPYDAAVANTSSVTNSQRVQSLEPGMMEYLAPGETVSFAQPNRPGNTFEAAILTFLRAIGAALGLPLELVLKDFSRTNYSSARAAMLEARRFFKMYQEWMIQRFCQPTWEMIVEEAWLAEELPSVNLFTDHREDWLNARWIAPGWGWVDPTKEVESAKESIKAGLSTLADECAALGRDWEETAEQRKREQDKLAELGLVVDTGTTGETQPGEGQPTPGDGEPHPDNPENPEAPDDVPVPEGDEITVRVRGV